MLKNKLIFTIVNYFIFKHLKILYKYILFVRVKCEKYRLRGEANFLSGEGNLTVLETGILTNNCIPQKKSYSIFLHELK
jgi:hypothetical protein